MGRGNLQVRRQALAYLEKFGRITTTAVTIFERLRGYRAAIREGRPFEPQLRAFEAFVATCVVLPFDEDAADVASRIWSAAARSRRRELGDILIASIAVVRRLPLVTRNRRDFELIATDADLTLDLIDWSRPMGKGTDVSADPANLGQNPFALLSLIAAPAVLTNAASVLALSTSNRFLRASERMRGLTSRYDESLPPAARALMVKQIARVERRGRPASQRPSFGLRRDR